MKRQDRGCRHGNEDPPHGCEEKRSLAAVVLPESGGKSDCVLSRNICIPCHRIHYCYRSQPSLCGTLCMTGLLFPAFLILQLYIVTTHIHTYFKWDWECTRTSLSLSRLGFFFGIASLQTYQCIHVQGKEPQRTTRRRTRGGEIRRFRVLN